MRKNLLKAMCSGYQGDIDRAQANIEVYLTNPVGIGEHSDIVEAIDTELAKLAEAHEKLETLNHYFPE